MKFIDLVNRVEQIKAVYENSLDDKELTVMGGTKETWIGVHAADSLFVGVLPIGIPAPGRK